MARTGSKAKKARDAPDKGDQTEPVRNGLDRPSPDPATNLLIADLALRGGARLMRYGIERGLLGTRYSQDKTKSILKGRSLGRTLLHATIARIATHSMPGALLIGGGLVLRTLAERRKGRQARLEGEAQLQAMAEDGQES
jgi:hypothetical protein